MRELISTHHVNSTLNHIINARKESCESTCNSLIFSLSVDSLISTTSSTHNPNILIQCSWWAKWRWLQHRPMSIWATSKKQCQKLINWKKRERHTTERKKFFCANKTRFSTPSKSVCCHSLSRVLPPAGRSKVEPETCGKQHETTEKFTSSKTSPEKISRWMRQRKNEELKRKINYSH